MLLENKFIQFESFIVTRVKVKKLNCGYLLWMNRTPTVIAHAVENKVCRVQIPRGLRAGDDFVYNHVDGRIFTIIVPEGSTPGSFIEFNVSNVIPAELSKTADEPSKLKVDKAVVGAGFAGVVVGTLILGPFAGLIIGGGAAFMAHENKSKMGKTVRELGDLTCKGVSKAKDWIEDHVK
jgi:hypothetical protein